MKRAWIGAAILLAMACGDDDGPTADAGTDATTDVGEMDTGGGMDAGEDAPVESDAGTDASLCGNGTVDDGEACDTMIAAGEEGACPTECADDMDCTADVLENEGTCMAACSFPAITEPADGDMCCPDGANGANDDACMPDCGNGIRETGEACDDGNDVDDDLCSNTCENAAMETAFRVKTMELVDPQIFATLGSICIPGIDTANMQLQTSIDRYALNALVSFQPLDAAAPSTPVDVYLMANCMAGLTPDAPDRCVGSDEVAGSTAINMESGACYTAPEGTRHEPYGEINQPTDDCFSASTREVTFLLAGAPITLTNVTIAAEYEPNGLANGIIAGFLDFETARTTTINLSSVGIGEVSVFSLLQSDMGGDACDVVSGPNPTPATDADDLDGDGRADGWWFFINITAEGAELVPRPM